MEKQILIASIDIIPGFEQEIKNATIALAADTRKEAACELFLIHTREDTPRSLVFYEIYRSKQAFEQHKTFAHSQKYFRLLQGRVENDKPGVTLLRQLDN